MNDTNLHLETSSTGIAFTTSGCSLQMYNKIYYEEDDLYYINYILLPGMTKNWLNIVTITEKDFFTVRISANTTTNYSWLYEGTKEEPKNMHPINIVRSINDVELKGEIKINMDNGLLIVKIPKKYPIKREELKF